MNRLSISEPVSQNRSNLNWKHCAALALLITAIIAGGSGSLFGQLAEWEQKGLARFIGNTEEVLVSDIFGGSGRHAFVVTKFGIYGFLIDTDGLLDARVDFFLTRPRTILDASFKSDDPTVMLILLDDGSIYRSKAQITGENSGFWPDPEFVTRVAEAEDLSGSESRIEGDALYVISGTNVYVSRDTAKTWALDTLGMGNSYVNDIAMDTLQYAWLATDNGIFTQHPDSTGWTKNTTFPRSRLRSIHVDSGNRIFAGVSGRVYTSADWGTTWDIVPGRIDNAHSGLSSDEFGNIYAIEGFGAAFRSDSGNTEWVNISDAIAELAAPSNGSGYIEYSGIVNSITGADSTLYASTIYGLFTSADRGETWAYSNAQAPDFNFYSIVSSGDYDLISGTQGVFRVMKNDTVISKVLPEEGFQSSINLFSDSTGTLFALLPVKTGKWDTHLENYISTDNGLTWQPDSLGLHQFQINLNSRYSVTDAGTQYASNPGTLWSKKLGSGWAIDTLGLNLGENDQINQVSANTKKGMVYALKRISSTEYQLFSKPTDSGNWQQIDVSMFGATALKMASYSNGDVIIYSRAMEMSLYDGNSWNNIPLPMPASGAVYPDLMVTDRDGVIYSSFQYDVGEASHAVYYTDDLGQSWEKAGLDSLFIRYMYTHEDITYVITENDGIFSTDLNSGGTVSIDDEGIASNYQLFQNYPNPFNPSTTISFSLGKPGRTTLTVYNVLGQKVLTLIDRNLAAGTHSVRLNANNLASGMYIYILKTGETSLRKKFILVK